MTSYGSQVIEESIDLLKERPYTTMHFIEYAWREYGGYVRDKVEEYLRHASPAAIVKVFVCIITDGAAVDTQPEFHDERVIFETVFVDGDENETDMLLPPWPDACTPNARLRGFELQERRQGRR